MSDLGLTDRELQRYARQLVIPELGGEGQMRLKRANVLVVGAGALGTVAAGYLVAAGAGRVGIVDSDTIELANLQRQLLYWPHDIGEAKAETAALRLGAFNDDVLVEPYPAHVDAANVEALLAGRDVALDCCDSFETRYLVNDAAVQLGVPLVEAGVLGVDGLVMTIIPGVSACYRCAFPDPPEPGTVPGCAEAGILGPVAGVIGSLQALEAIKLITGIGESLTDRVLQVEGRDLAFTSVHAGRRPDCVACGGVGAPDGAGASGRQGPGEAGVPDAPIGAGNPRMDA